jgi:hypothetical protein
VALAESIAPARRTPHFGNEVYPLGFFGGNALRLQRLLPHLEQRMRFAMSASLASHPQSLPKVVGWVLRS